MRIESLGGGPAGLYFAILMKKAFPDAAITIHERNRADDTFGWGVVFSDETLSNFEIADRESYAEIRRRFAYWGDIETYYGDTCVRSTGHGFCGLARKKLLEIFHARCRELGVELRFQDEVTDIEELRSADLVLAADGLNSIVRKQYAEHFEPTVEWRSAKFCWLGTTKPLAAFTFIFRESEHGLFKVHAYPFEKDLSTFIVECREDTWKRAGLDRASEEETVAFCETLFADHLDGHRCCRTARAGARSRPSATSAGTTGTSCCSATPRTRRTSRSARARSSRWRTRSRSRRRSSRTGRATCRVCSRPTSPRASSTCSRRSAPRRRASSGSRTRAATCASIRCSSPST